MSNDNTDIDTEKVVTEEQNGKNDNTSLQAQKSNKPVKRRRKRGKLKPKFGEEYVEPGDNSKYLRYARVSLGLPPIDISDPEQVEARINAYFDFCEDNDRKPSMISMANWLGISRETVNTWKRGDFRSATHSEIIRRAVNILEEIWVDYMQNGKINPASGIFLAKNMFQYRDVQDIVVAPQNNIEVDLEAEEIAKRYLEDGNTMTTTFVEDTDH